MSTPITEPVISTKYDFDPVTKTYFVQIFIQNLATEQQAITCLDFATNALCGEEINIS